jgi:hypothetical protein
MNKELAKTSVYPTAKAHYLESAEKCKQMIEWLRELQERRKAPEIIFCKDCAKHNKSYGDNGAIDSCPLVLYRGKAQGHEFDYQYCAFAERRTNEDD